jgi:two-component system response regulator DevR
MKGAQREPRIKLMLVDDHEVVRMGLRALFDETDTIEIIGEAATAAAAVTQARKLAPDVVLMDMRLPDRSGVEACREILSADPETRVLFLTSYSDEEAVTSTVLAGAAGYLLKEINPKALIRAVETVAEGGSILDPKVTQTVLKRMHGAVTQSPDAQSDEAIASLSPQERRVLALVVEGKSNKEIASALRLSDKTVANYLGNAFQKLNVRRRWDAAALFSRKLNKTPD